MVNIPSIRPYASVGGGYGVERVSVKFNMVPPENQQMEKEIPAFENIMFKLHVNLLGCMTFYYTSWFRGMIIIPISPKH